MNVQAMKSDGKPSGSFACVLAFSRHSQRWRSGVSTTNIFPKFACQCGMGFGSPNL